MLLLAIAGIMMVATASAQNHRASGYYNPRTGQLDYSSGRHTTPVAHSYNYFNDSYVGLRIGPSFTHVSSDDPALDGSSWKTGLNVGIAVGTNISYHAPLYLETGLYYTEKGGKGKNSIHGKNFTFDLNYLELPLIFKYKAPVTREFSVEPYFGGYFGVGISGQIKDYDNRESYSSFSSNKYDSNTFQRCDGGLKFGIGASYRLDRDAELYVELGYDLGLTNISHDTFDKSKNGALQLNFGVNL